MYRVEEKGKGKKKVSVSPDSNKIGGGGTKRGQRRKRRKNIIPG